MRYVFGGEPVEVEGHGVGVMVDREFRPDGWEWGPLRLVLIRRGNRLIAAAFEPAAVTVTHADKVPRKLRDDAWEFMERRRK